MCTLGRRSCSLQGGTLRLPPAQQVLPPHALLRCRQLSTTCTLLQPPSRCYSFGPRFNVEMEVVLPGTMTVAESHDIALDLQHKVRGGCRGCCTRCAGLQCLPGEGRGASQPYLELTECSTFFTGDWAADADCRASLPQLEALEDVERAFVHVDYEKRSWPEHKVSGSLQGRVLPVGWMLGAAPGLGTAGASRCWACPTARACVAAPLILSCLRPHC